MTSDPEKEIRAIMASLVKSYGEGSIFMMNETPDTGVKNWLSTGIPAIDAIFGGRGRGLPFGRVVTFLGKGMAGKSTLVTHVMVAYQRKWKGVPIYWSTEYSYDPQRAARIGLDLSKVAIGYPGFVEEAFEWLFKICNEHSGEFPLLVIWDTFSASPTAEELYGTGEEGKKRRKDDEVFEGADTGGKSVGLHSKLVSQNMRKLQSLLEEKQVLLLVVLQSKDNINAMFGGGETYLAEKPWFFYSNIQAKCTYMGQVKSGETPIGIRSKVECKKNKVGPPFGSVEMDCYFENGFDINNDLLVIATKKKITLPKGGGWFDLDCPGLKCHGMKFMRRSDKHLNWDKVLETYPELVELLEKE